METQFFIIAKGKATLCTEAEIVAQEYDLETEIAVTVTGNYETAWNIEACDWYSGQGICRLTVNSFPLAIALRVFAEAVEAFNRAESEGETKRVSL